MHTLPNLPQSVANEIHATLCEILPSPRIDTPENRAARADTAMGAIAGLHPADAAEALFAVQIIGANAHALDCMRLAALPGQQPENVRHNRAQAASMMRFMQSGLRMLKRDQAAREKLEAAMHPATMERAGWWFRDASVPGPEPADEPEAAPPTTAEPAAETTDEAWAAREFSELSEAEQYAILYPERAAIIRAHGGLPPHVDFGPPDEELAEAIVNSKSPILQSLDQRPRVTVAARGEASDQTTQEFYRGQS